MPMLAGGWKHGDKAVYVGTGCSDANGTIEFGDVGNVIALGMIGADDGDQPCVKCIGFPTYGSFYNATTTQILKEAAFKAPLPGGWGRGDKVVYVGTNHSDDYGTVERGDAGIVIGPYETDHEDYQGRLQCNGFPNYKKNFHLDPKVHILAEAAFNAPKKTCAACKADKYHSMFAKAQLKRSGPDRRCMDCIEKGKLTLKAKVAKSPSVKLLQCAECSLEKPPIQFWILGRRRL